MRMLLVFTVAVILLWVAGLLLFVQSMPSRPLPAAMQTDAIIVLTGGNARVERGFSMLAEGAAPILMISGVGKDVTLQEMLLAHADAATRAAIDARGAAIVLDHVAVTTHTNAAEIAAFVAERRIRSARIITAHYHMQRSLAEIHAAAPTVTLVADPVFPSGFQRSQWWRHTLSRRLVISEFHKYIAVAVRSWVKPSA